MKNKKFGIEKLAAFCAWISSIAVVAIALAYLPKYIGSAHIAFPIVGIAMLVCALIFAVINLVFVRRFVKKYSKPDNMVSKITECDELLRKAKNNYLRAEKDLFRCINLITAYKVLIFLYFICAMSFFVVGAAENNPLSVVSYVLCAITSLFYALPLIDFVVDDASIVGEEPLREQDYPLLFETVREASKALNCNKPFKIYPVVYDGISVSSSNGVFNIFVDVEEFAILTKDELYQIMLHEIAHVINKDTRRSLKLDKFSRKIETVSGRIVVALFLTRNFVDFAIKKEIYSGACRRYYEQNADSASKQYGNPQSCIDATAKTMLLAMYNNGYKPEISFYIYEDENPPKDLLLRNLSNFQKYLEKNADRWNFILNHKLPSRMDTHPTFQMRKEFMGVENYDYTRVEQDENYKAEQRKLLQWGCDLYASKTASYERTRKEYYLPNLEKLREYRALREKGEAFTSAKKVEYLHVLYLADRDECLLACNEVLRENPRSAYANIYKGLILAAQLDGDCVDCLYLAAQENVYFAETALDAVGTFACNVGDSELLEKYRAQYVEDMRNVLQKKFDNELHQGDQLRPNDLPENDAKAVLDFILSKGAQIVTKIYSVSRGSGMNMRTFYYIETAKKVSKDKFEKFFDEVYDFLDQYGEGDGNVINFALYSRYSGRKDINLIKKVDGALIFSSDKA